jgi:serine/threonine protein kinase
MTQTLDQAIEAKQIQHKRWQEISTNKEVATEIRSGATARCLMYEQEIAFLKEQDPALWGKVPEYLSRFLKAKDIELIHQGYATNVFRYCSFEGLSYIIKLSNLFDVDYALQHQDIALEREIEIIDRIKCTSNFDYMKVYTYTISEEKLIRCIRTTLLSKEWISLLAGKQAIYELYYQILCLVSTLHAFDVIHRDIHPRNFVFDFQTSKPRLIDFGLAYYGHSSFPLTSFDLLRGTPGFMSPESVFGKAPLYTSDVFSLGCLLFWMLTGENILGPPHNYEYNALAMYSTAGCWDIVRRAATDHKKLTFREWTFILKAIEYKPGMRFSSVNDMIESFKEISNE